MPTGTVKWFSNEKGYGFITPDEGGEDVFVHHSGIEASGYKTLAEGAKVEYQVTQGQKGPQPPLGRWAKTGYAVSCRLLSPRRPSPTRRACRNVCASRRRCRTDRGA